MAMGCSRKTVIIEMVDEDFIGHILPCKESKETPKRRQREKESSQNLIKRSDILKFHIEDAPDEAVVQKPHSLLEANEELCGGDVYMFKTPKSKHQIKEIAMTLIDKERNSEKTKTPGKAKKALEKSNSRKRKESPVEDKKTPYALRRKIKQRLAKTVRDASSESSSSEEELSDSDDEIKPDKFKELNSSNPCLLLNNQENGMSDEYEDYFTRQDNRLTSDHTLARLKNPRLPQDSLASLLDQAPNMHETEIQALSQKYKSLYKKWMLLMSEGFNVLLYGLGSKRDLLSDFHETMLADENCIVINGFFPNVTLKEIFSSIIEDVLELQCRSQNVQEQLNFIKKATVNEKDDLYLIIHNIDGSTLRSEKIQNLISQLAQLPWIHMISSIDHINAPLLWDQQKMSRFQWIWFDVTTFKPYKDEIAFENSLLVQPSKDLVLSSLIHVFRSLNPKAKGIFELIGRHQLENKGCNNYIGLSYQDCYRKCREAFLVNSDLTLRAQLTEFKDHKLIKFKKGLDGAECLLIPLDSNALSDFLDNHL